MDHRTEGQDLQGFPREWGLRMALKVIYNGVVMDETHDQTSIRCRRLGSDVPFLFCRTEGEADEPCRLLRDCWWERFDILTYIRENYSPDVAERLEADAPPPTKAVGLFEMIQQAQERLAKKQAEGGGE
jgi:hypothetical protein